MLMEGKADVLAKRKVPPRHPFVVCDFEGHVVTPSSQAHASMSVRCACVCFCLTVTASMSSNWEEVPFLLSGPPSPYSKKHQGGEERKGGWEWKALVMHYCMFL